MEMRVSESGLFVPYAPARAAASKEEKLYSESKIGFHAALAAKANGYAGGKIGFHAARAS